MVSQSGNVSALLKQLTYSSENYRRQMVCHMSMLPGSQLNSAFYFRAGSFRREHIAVTLSKSILNSPLHSKAQHGRTLSFSLLKQKGNSHLSSLSHLLSYKACQLTCFNLSSRLQNMTLKLSFPKGENISRICWNVKPTAWILGGTSAGIFVSLASSKPISADADAEEGKDDGSAIPKCHGKKVFTDYVITGIPGDGRCLFRSVAHGACLRSGKPAPDEPLQRELADDLRSRVADEFVKRRAETEWFIEGDFDTYVSHMRKPHVWGGEPELLMATHVLQMPITVYMHDGSSGGLIAIAEYGQEYGRENPIRILYHGFGHYDSLQISAMRGKKSRL